MLVLLEEDDAKEGQLIGAILQRASYEALTRDDTERSWKRVSRSPDAICRIPIARWF
jgi:DNA-binding response OmpR family regulator